MCCLFAASAMAQEAAVETTPAAVKKATENVKVMLTEDGTLEGNAVRTDSKAVAANVKVTLSADGKVVDAVETDEKGNFSFANVAPGAYQMLGSADGMVGSAAYNVIGYDAGSSYDAYPLSMSPASSDFVYDSYASQPVSSFASGCNTCGGGLGGGSLGGRLGGGFGSRLGGGGGLLSNPRIGLIGLVGLAGLGGDDASPDR